MFLNNSETSISLQKLACSIVRKRNTNVFNFVHLALKLTTQPCEFRKSYLSIMRQYNDVRYVIASA